MLLVAIATMVPTGIAGALLGRFKRAGAAPASSPATMQLPSLTGASLDIQRVSVAFGGNVALDAVAMTVRPGEVHALVGANGSGKTTLLNVISGLLHPSDVVMTLGDAALTGSAIHRSQLGVARTFQAPRVEAGASVRAAVLTGAFRRYRSGFIGLFLWPWSQRREEQQLRTEADDLLGALGLGHRLETAAGQLPHGELRLVEVARALITHPRLLLLDEPAAGLVPAELDHLATVVDAAAAAGCTVVLVEHNLAFVQRVATTATVLDRGVVVATGGCAEVLGRPDVLACFIGGAAA